MFLETIAIIQKVLERNGSVIDIEKYDGLMVKQLKTSNSLAPDRGNTNQTHIAITGSQRNMFPYILAPDFGSGDGKDPSLKKYLTLQIPADLHYENLNYLMSNREHSKRQDEKVYISVVPRGSQDQLQLSLTEQDSPAFIEFRKALPVDSYLIVLKRKESFYYDLYGIKPDDSTIDDNSLSSINNKFEYLLSTLTPVRLDEVEVERQEAASDSGSNILLYGVPGAGKSYTVEHKYTHGSTNVERVVFHPDYTYSDFVGQIMPTVHEDKSVSYEFVPGPFTRILKSAKKDPSHHYWLIIEEINRGNAPAIFGDLFQLLDRDINGESEYGITNADIAGEVFGDRKCKVKLPGNLSIIATMNTSDQNVFTLDTAFQRRWQMSLIDNDFDACEDKALMTTEVLDTGIQWKDFAKEINKRIVDANSNNMISTADKQLGTHFVSSYELSKDDVFAEKVLKYLWDDAVKMNHEQVFASKYGELRAVIKDFKTTSGDARLDIFNDLVKKAMQKVIDDLNAESKENHEPADGSDVD